jgi:hypothetical protein
LAILETDKNIPKERFVGGIVVIMKKITLVTVCWQILFLVNCLAGIEPVSFLDPGLAKGNSANGYSAVSDMSPDGRFVLFDSLASNLTTNDYNYCADIFLRDRLSGTTTLVSSTPDGFSGNGGSSSFSMSTNGAWVVFQSDADDLVAGDNNGMTDIFVRSVTLGQTVLVSANTNGTSANGPSDYAIMTPDGRFVAFESTATDLVTNTTGFPLLHTVARDIYLRDLSSNTTTLISISTNGLTGGNGSSQLAGLSADGRYVLFSSAATNLGAGVFYSSEIFLRDTQAQRTYWISTNMMRIFGITSPSSYAATCFNPVMNEDGQKIAFRVIRMSSSLVLLHDLASNTTSLISSNRLGTTLQTSDNTGPSISADGNVLAYAEVESKYALSSTNQIFVWSSRSGTNTLASLAANGVDRGNVGPVNSVLSADGSTLAFLSEATNLVANTPVAGHSRLYIRDLETGVLKLVNLETNLDKPPGDVLEYPVLSANGSLVAFGSSSDGLVDNENNGTDDVFVHTTQTGVTELISSISPAMDFAIASSGSFIAENGLSRDGRFAVFSTTAENMVLGDTNLCWDILVRDMLTKTLLLVSVNADGTGTGNGSSMQPSISADGNWVAFQSEASDLVAGDTNKTTDVFLRNLDTQETLLVSKVYGGTGSSKGVSEYPVITPDGRFVVFRSKVVNLTATNYDGAISRLYAYDTASGTNAVVLFNGAPVANPTLQAISPDSQFAAFIGRASQATIPFYIYDLSTQVSEKIDDLSSQTVPLAAFSGDGRWLAYINAVTTRSNRLTLCDLIAKTNMTFGVDGGVWKISLNGDGSRMAYETIGTGSMPTNTHQIFLFDTSLGSNVLVSANLAGDNGGNDDSRNPIISPDGRRVYFNSHASDLTTNADQHIWANVFVRDLSAGTTQLLSINRFTTGAGNSQTVLRTLSANGQVVAMESLASDLAPGDYNMNKDVFVLHVNESVADSDNDGLADSWEIEKFGSLERDGTGDFDGDGMSDGAEFLAGTDPGDSESLLRVTQISRNNETGRLIVWKAAAGKTYQVQYKESLGVAAWTDLEGTVTAEASTASKADDTVGAAGQRFYRVMLVP